MLDVIVVGAGLSGLTVALRVQQAGRRSRVLEAADRVGGRVRSEVVGGEMVDLGGEAVGRTQRRVRDVAVELGIELEPLGLWTRPVLWRGQGTNRSARLPTRSVRELVELGRVLVALSRLATRVDPAQPWRGRHAGELDRMSFATLLDQLDLRTSTRGVLEAAVGTLATESVEEVSALQVLWWIAAAGGLIPSALAATQYRFTAGAESLAEAIASRLHDDVELGERIARIVQTNAGVQVTSETGRGWEARAAVVALPLTKIADLDFDPPLPPARRAAHHSLGFGRLTKIVGIIDRSERARAGLLLGGEVVTAGWRRGPVVTGFAYGPAANEPEEVLFDDLGTAFDVHEWIDRRLCRWHEQLHIAGSYLTTRPGQLRLHGPQLTSNREGRVWFAGNDRSSAPDTIEGAVRSGEQISRQLLARLGSSSR